MQFSLKDLFWSITLASCGVVSLRLCFSEFWETADSSAIPALLIDIAGILLVFVFPGTMFGAAVGKLFHRTKLGIVLGLIAWTALICIAMGMAGVGLRLRTLESANTIYLD